MTTTQVIALFRMKGLIRSSMTCPHCEQSMSERFKRDVIDKTSWVCFNSQCPKPYTTVSVRAGSFFEKFRISLADVWTVILMWSENASIAGVVKSYGLSKTTVIKIYAMLREKVSRHLQIEPIRLGGPGIICQIDESLFCHKQKYHRGRVARAQTWVFGIVDTSFKPAKGYVEVVSDRSAETLLEIINRVCRPGSIIYSDEWAAYKRIQERLGFEHRTVNHSLNFVDPSTGVHTQNIESYWARQKQRIKAMKGIQASQLPSLLKEFVWQDNMRGRVFLCLIGLLIVE